MCPRAIVIILVSIVSLAFGQRAAGENLERTFQFIHTDNEKNLQEITTAVRVITDMKEASLNAAQKTLTVRGTAVQIGVAEWLWKELDQAPAASVDSAVHEYRLPEGSSDRGETVVRVFYLPRTPTVQDFQEAATLIRTIADIRRVFTYTNASRALVLRGTAGQIALAEWLIGQVGDPTSSATASVREFRLPYAPVKGVDEGVVRVYFLKNTATVQAFQEEATLIRAIAEIRRVFTYNAPRALALRGTDDQIALAAWLLQTLDQSASAQPDTAPRQYKVSGSTDDVVRVFTLAHAGTPQRVQEIATEVRSTTGVPRLFTLNPTRVLALRGTAGQITQADRLIKQRDQ